MLTEAARFLLRTGDFSPPGRLCGPASMGITPVLAFGEERRTVDLHQDKPIILIWPRRSAQEEQPANKSSEQPALD